MFQSLSRDSGRLNRRREILHPAPGVGFQSLSRDSGRLNSLRSRLLAANAARFNPSVGIRGV